MSAALNAASLEPPKAPPVDALYDEEASYELELPRPPSTALTPNPAPAPSPAPSLLAENDDDSYDDAPPKPASKPAPAPVAE